MSLSVLLNPMAGGGRAAHRWRRVEPVFRRSMGPHVHVLADPSGNGAAVRDALAAGCRRFVAAGGDGTVQALLQALIEATPPDDLASVRVGALGLGSSNDFHKPFSTSQQLAGYPCRLALDRAVPRDVGVLRLEEEDGVTCPRYWLLNASIGVTANANALFNHPDRVLSSLKRYSTALSILYVAGSAISHARSRDLTLDGRLARTTNLGIVKSPHFSGSFRYDSPLALQNGRLFVHICEEMTVPRLLLTLAHLSRGGFTGLPRTRSEEVESLTVEADERFAVEFDGEIAHTRRATFSVLPQLLRVCP